MTAKKLKLKWNRFWPLAAMAILPVLSGCANPSDANAATMRIYQARTLTVAQGTQIQTVDGLYEAQTREVWYSSQAYLDLLHDYEEEIAR